ncbi:MAG TPA: hypothetical protein VK968_02670, partial [Roseimicrobium sp.]|nr:hypothetical protein [Roseimicrobium sp.]
MIGWRQILHHGAVQISAHLDVTRAEIDGHQLCPVADAEIARLRVFHQPVLLGMKPYGIQGFADLFVMHFPETSLVHVSIDDLSRIELILLC